MSDNYNGWKNYETWNVMLWLNNDAKLYNRKLVVFRKWIKAGVTKPTYIDLVRKMNVNIYTPDGVQFRYTGALDLVALDQEITTEFNEYKEYAK